MFFNHKYKYGAKTTILTRVICEPSASGETHRVIEKEDAFFTKWRTLDGADSLGTIQEAESAAKLANLTPEQQSRTIVVYEGAYRNGVRLAKGNVLAEGEKPPVLNRSKTLARVPEIKQDDFLEDPKNMSFRKL